MAVRRWLVKQLQEAGVGLLLGTDAAGFAGTVPGYAVHWELQELVQAGLTPYEALGCAFPFRATSS